MRRLGIVVCLLLTVQCIADAGELDIDPTLPVPALRFDRNGNLMMTASRTSTAADFDYLVGHWRLTNRKLQCRLHGCTQWLPPFESFVDMEKVLGGAGNIDRYHEKVGGKALDGLALRLFDPSTRLWSIYWADGRRGTLDPPVVGSFTDGIGHFFGKDTFEGREIVVVFRWDVRNPQRPVWSQAFSADRGRTWEWNSINVSERVAP